MKKVSRFLMEVIAIVLIIVSLVEIAFYGIMSSFKYHGYDDVCYNDRTLDSATAQISAKIKGLSKIGSININLNEENTNCNFYDYEDYVKYLNGESESCEIKTQPIDNFISYTSSSYYDLQKNEDGYYDLIKYVGGMLNIQNGENVENILGNSGETYRFIFNKENFRDFDFFEKENNDYDTYEEFIAEEGYGLESINGFVSDEGAYFQRHSSYGAAVAETYSHNNYYVDDEVKDMGNTRERFKTDVKNYLRIPAGVYIELINKYSGSENVKKLELGYYGATGIYKYTNGDKEECVFTNGTYIWSTTDPTPISGYVYVPMDSLQKIDEETILKSGVSLERVIYGTNYDYVIYKKSLYAYDGSREYDYDDYEYYNFYRDTLMDELSALSYNYVKYEQVTLNDKLVKNKIPDSNEDLYCKINVSFNENEPDISIEKIDGTIIKLDNSWELYKSLKNVEPFNIKATYYLPVTSIFENELQANYDKVKDKADDRLFTWGVVLLLAFILTLVIIIILPKKNEEFSAYENFFDFIWFEIFIAIDAAVYTLTYIWFYEETIAIDEVNKSLVMKIGLLGIIGCVVFTYMTVMTFARRVVKRRFFKSLFMYIPFRIAGKAAGAVKRELNKSANSFIDKKFKKSNIFKLRIVLLAMFYIINLILGITYLESYDAEVELISGVVLVGFNIYVILKCVMNAINEQDIVNGIAVIASGKLDHRINTEHMKKIEKDVAENVNNIGKGLEYAVEDSIKAAKKSVNDERLKAELITNVSHDIKTPLTSIINYVDLLKREHIDNPKCEEYINVLEKKSYRLKMLIEDLVEASKITTGNITLYMERINLNELLNQVLGEYDDKFSEKNLMVDTEYYKEPLYISADGRRIFRVVDNLLQNVYKYSQENTRVYVKLLSNGTNAKIIIKNTSKAKLDIDPEELKERFKRGDESRSSEGNGLGLSIADSLVTLMSGTMQLFIDGDLFKVEVTFPINNDVKINVIEGNLIENCPKSASEPEETECETPEETALGEVTVPKEYTEVAETPNELMNVDMYNLNEIEDDSNKRILEDKQGSYMIESDDNK